MNTMRTAMLTFAIVLCGSPYFASPESASDNAQREVQGMVTVLAKAPYLMPASAEKPFVGVPVAVDETGGLSLGVPHAALGANPEIERHRPAGLSRAPSTWIFVLDESGHVAFWAPLSDSRTVRVETPAAGENGPIDGALFHLKTGHSIVYVPFLPGGSVVAVSGTAGRAVPAGGPAVRRFGMELP